MRPNPLVKPRLAVLQPEEPGIVAHAHLHLPSAKHVAAHSFGLPEILVHYFFLVTVFLKKGQLDMLPAANNSNKLRTW